MDREIKKNKILLNKTKKTNLTENNSPNNLFFLLEFHADTGCDYRDNEMLYPLAYRTHSHNLGKILIHKILELDDVYTIPWIENVCIHNFRNINITNL